jgi:hypothetical protein
MDNMAGIKDLVSIRDMVLRDNRGHTVDIQVHNIDIQLMVIGSKVHIYVRYL